MLYLFSDSSCLQANNTYLPAETCLPSVSQLIRCEDSLSPHDHLYETPFSRDITTSADSQRLNGKNNGSDIRRAQDFDKSALQLASVVQQVDRKFISCLLPQAGIGGLSSPQLVLVDQHAADERVRVERLLKPLCEGYLQNRTLLCDSLGDVDGNAIGLRVLSPPLCIVLTAHEASRLASSPEVRAAFADWGFYFDLPLRPRTEIGPDATYSQVAINRIPEIVGDKVSTRFSADLS